MSAPVKSTQPIGIFDSGIGGLTVADAIRRKLPNEEILYFGDTAHLPYGEKSPGAIKHFAEGITRYLLGQSCKLVIIACNTASSVAFDFLCHKLGPSVILINVIDPVVQRIADDETIQNVGVIGTKGTIRSNAYERKLLEKRPSLKVSSLATPLLVSMIEEGFFNNKISQTIINAYLNYPDFKMIDALILGCTHFPLINAEINRFFDDEVVVFDSTDVVADECEGILQKRNLLNDQHSRPQHRFMVSDFTHSFEQTTRLFFREKVSLQHIPLWDEAEPLATGN